MRPDLEPIPSGKQILDRNIPSSTFARVIRPPTHYKGPRRIRRRWTSDTPARLTSIMTAIQIASPTRASSPGNMVSTPVPFPQHNL